ncbi:MAG: FG-GAP-like repeat-containing protein, partial [Candidatus Bathyarchaeota archaeon]|nr:FG-GAP-like repeat-containing protein [Candidatus Bathyarchaeota archaeon]
PAVERFGEAVSYGDFNGDGFDDLLIGAPENKLVGTNTGRAYIYYGGHIPNNVVDMQISTNIAGERFGSAVASGDINGDGYSDAIVGAENYSLPIAHSGRTYCFLGGSGMDSVADHILEPTGYSEWFGCAVAAGDFWNASNDAPSVGALAGANDAGKIYVFDKPWIAPLPSPISQDTNVNVTIDLSQYEHSLKYSANPQALRWFVTSYDPAAIASITGEGSDDDVLTFQPVTDFQGHTFVGLLLNDTDGRNATCTLHIYWGGTNVAPTLVDMKLQFYVLNRTQTQGIYINATDSGIGADEESAQSAGSPISRMPHKTEGGLQPTRQPCK